MTQKTPLHSSHVNLGAKMVDFGGWDMPLHYGSQLNEHHTVRQDAGVFDVSHMTIVDVNGEKARDYLRFLLANDVAKLQAPGQALYSCMLNENGGIIDDLIVYFFDSTFYRVIVNASTRDKDMAWMAKQAKGFAITLSERCDLAMIAAQGPSAYNKLRVILDASSAEKIQTLKPFHAVNASTSINNLNLFIARTGYTGEDGFEILVQEEQAVSLWQMLMDAGFAPCGLGARDTLRLEAGLNLYGSDMDETTTPFESNLAWTVAFNSDRKFLGREALEAQKEAGITRKLVGLILHERGGVLRGHQKIEVDAENQGQITSGSFSPTLNKSVALARVAATDEENCAVDIRGKRYAVERVTPPFVKRGQRK